MEKEELAGKLSETEREYGRQYRKANRERLREWRKQYWAANREQILEKKRQYWAANKERAKQYRLANQEKIRQYRKRYNSSKSEHIKTHRHHYKMTNLALVREQVRLRAARRRAIQRQAPINDLTPAQWREIKAAYDHRCVYCDRQMQRLTMDHIVPLAKGGSHTASNIVPACLSCNSRKGTGAPLRPVQPLLLTVEKSA